MTAPDTAGMSGGCVEEGVMAPDVPRGWAAANIDAQVRLAWSQIAAGHLAPADAAGLALRTLLQGLGQR